MKLFLLTVIASLLLWPAPALAQTQRGDYGLRFTSADGRWVTPVATRILCSDEKKHADRGSVNAWDLCAPYGSPVYAMGVGRVLYAGCNNAGGYGCWVLLQHGDGYSSSYGHMISGSIRVKIGQEVNHNTILGQIGRTGITSFGPHVHWEIRKGGQFLHIDQFFVKALMRICNLCNFKGDPVMATGILRTSGSIQRVSAPLASQSSDTGAVGVTSGLSYANAERMVLLMAIFGTLYLVWFFGKIARVGLREAAVLSAVALTPFLSPSAMIGGEVAATGALSPALTVLTSRAATASKTWDAAYTFMRRWEGSKCTHDPVRTYKGVTNSTYNSWRMQQGLGAGDVCRDMTDAQMKQIYHDRFWVTSGAHKLPGKIAVMMFDWYVNAGYGDKGAAKKALAACGADLSCLVERRATFYRNADGCPLYCAGWFNRLNDIVKYLNRL